MPIRSISMLLALLLATGCTTMRAVEQAPSEVLEPGDEIVAYERSGRIVAMTVETVDDEFIAGRLQDGGNEPITVAVADIEKLEIERIDGARTTLAVVGGTVVLLPLAVIAALTAGMAGQ